ncbi:GNAT family N-acetyltransferase [Paenibacillus sp. MSJ-34]|uniref:GNAT family N-acetyltransferase n=1 Tax=Paenibacillus sp. MSJ-34 TaxID=2841529 RepID=UPI001C11062A|nr:GNAT family protein [Paenibacillus sp. MSJ-34]MBU5441269.1 GNAT family N-acetyltransferase [Paenibacillus sp. MSJ-34]
MTDQSVKLERYEAKFDEFVRQFELPEEQAVFTGIPAQMVGEAQGDANKHPIVITADSVPVGFFVLVSGERVKEYTVNPNALLLIAFSIDYRRQRKGYAKQGLESLHRFVPAHFPVIDEIVLSVNLRNVAAQTLYAKAGFEDRGGRKTGPIGEQKIMHLRLRKYCGL